MSEKRFSLRDFGLGFAAGAALTGTTGPVIKRKLLGKRQPRPAVVAVPLPGTGPGAAGGTTPVPAHPQPSSYDATAAATTLKKARDGARRATDYAVRGELEAAFTEYGDACSNLGMAIVHNQHAPPAGKLTDIPSVISELNASWARVKAAIRKR
ncbi:MAG TPA: hypothetical protein VEU33_05925 [Archangium sp.]|nr:hypothetical protein [Archangium sp.]